MSENCSLFKYTSHVITIEKNMDYFLTRFDLYFMVYCMRLTSLFYLKLGKPFNSKHLVII